MWIDVDRGGWGAGGGNQLCGGSSAKGIMQVGVLAISTASFQYWGLRREEEETKEGGMDGTECDLPEAFGRTAALGPSLEFLPEEAAKSKQN